MEINLDDKRIRYLSDKDKRLAKLIHSIGSIKVAEYSDDFAFVVCEIIGQMLSNKVADVMIERLPMLCEGKITIESVKNVGHEGLKAIGLSSAKVSYIYNILIAIETGELDFVELRNEDDDDDIIKKLKSIKGIRDWTAKMYLLFVLKSDNILPYDPTPKS